MLQLVHSKIRQVDFLDSALFEGTINMTVRVINQHAQTSGDEGQLVHCIH